jgi:hypothetical protein
MDVRVAPEDLAERVKICAAAELIGDGRRVVLAAAEGRNSERERKERSNKSNGHGATLTDAAYIAIDG